MAGLNTTRTTLKIPTKGPGDLINITDMVSRALAETGLKKGTVCVFVVGSTAAITTVEYEPGLIKDMHELFEKIAPSNRHYHHDETWGDNNGSSHIRASLFGPSIVIPFEDSKPSLGTWQQVVLAEFDTRSRSREVILQFTGE